jgi:hypothetical protein
MVALKSHDHIMPRFIVNLVFAYLRFEIAIMKECSNELERLVDAHPEAAGIDKH